MMNELQTFLANKTFPGRVVFAKVWGSRSHNTDLPDSDWDFSGLYVVKTRQYLGLGKWAETVQGEDKPDYAFHEAGKFCNLLLAGNPGIVEMLFTGKMTYETAVWGTLRENRRRFLSQKVVSQYMGYVDGQLKRLKVGSCLHTKGSGYTEKWAYHSLRLVKDGLRIARGGEPVVWKEGSERDLLLKVRNYHFSQKEVEEMILAGLEEIRDTPKSLPEMGDRDWLNDWLIGLRQDEWD